MGNDTSYETFTLDELADKWKCSRAHIDRLIAKGDLEAFKINRLTRVSLAEILAFEKRNVREPTAS